MKFALAKGDRSRIIYTIDNDSSQIEHLRIFQTRKMLHEWMAQNEDKTIRRMSIMYEYPSI